MTDGMPYALACRNRDVYDTQMWVLGYTLQHWAEGQLMYQGGFEGAGPMALVRLDPAGEPFASCCQLCQLCRLPEIHRQHHWP